MRAKDFFINASLYQRFLLEESENVRLLEDIVNFSGTIDLYCIECQKDSTYRSVTNFHANTLEQILRQTNYERNFTCTRNEVHRLIIYFRVTSEGFEKIGQYPSIASIENNTIKKYKKVLNSDYVEFSKAIGLFSHGIGVGSFVYLRRIFENLIFETYEKKGTKLGVEKSDFDKLRINEKIELLKDHLPDFLVKNSKLYSILSIGIHSLSEKECLDYFEPVKVGIEMILDQKIEEIERLKKIKEAEDKLTKLNAKLK